MELSLQELHAAPPQPEGSSDVLETLVRLSPPQEALTLRPSPALQERISALLDKLRNGDLSPDEELD